MAERKAAEIVAEMVELLTPLASEERMRVVQASMTLLGEGSTTSSVPSRTPNADSSNAPDAPLLFPRAQLWARQNNITMGELEQVFHFQDGAAELIAGDVPGANKKEKTYSTYILYGLSKFLSTGSTSFEDKGARALCELLGCYDVSNHSVTLKQKGNEFAGTKDKGWNLTAPGLTRAAAIVKSITKGEK